MPANDCCELDLSVLWWKEPFEYRVVGKFSDPTSDRENYLLEPIGINIDVARLQPLVLDPDAYGRALTEMFFSEGNGAIREVYVKARAAAATREGLRLRLGIEKNARELHAVRWETLRDPTQDTPLLTQSNLWFSRFVSDETFSIRPSSGSGSVGALVVIANPSDLHTKWGQPVLDAEAIYQRTQRALSAEPGAREFAVKPLQTRATIFNIVANLRESYSHILYLVCHGKLVADDAPRLLLENDEGTGEIVQGELLVEKLAGLSALPRLVVLASCESAGGQDGVVFGALGPRLVQNGVASVVAMQGDISVESVDKFTARLFKELSKDGQIDRAMAAARNDIREEKDWWMPALFTSSRTGCLWAGRPPDVDFDKWEAVVSDVREGDFVPVLGPSLVEPLFGSTREIAQQWAETYEFPLARRNRDDLAQVAQYLRYRQTPMYTLEQLRGYLARFIRKRFGDRLPADLRDRPIKPGVIDELVSHVGAMQRANNPNDVHRLLARLPAKIYVNANRDNLLRDALVEQKRQPQVQLSTWRTSNNKPLPIGPVLPPGYEPSVEQPLIFHVFGNLEFPASLVLTEDDYFDFLVAVTRNEALATMSVASKVSSALATSGLLLLGFHMNDWDFRVLFSSLLKQPGASLSYLRARVAIQIDPSEEGIIDPNRAVQYLSSFFTQQAQIGLYLGSAEQFLTHLIELCVKEEIIDK
jgi:hypothetical protein